MANYKKPFKMYDAEGNEFVGNKDLNNKQKWCVQGGKMEPVFIERFEKLGLIMNPEKRDSVYPLDLFHPARKFYADLKSQNTPFFTSQSKGIDPNYCVAFNEKDKDNYSAYLKDKKEIVVYFWINWIPVKWVHEDGRVITVEPCESVYVIKFSNILKLIKEQEKKGNELHEYPDRIGDTNGNAKKSYHFDVTHKSKYFRKLYPVIPESNV